MKTSLYNDLMDLQEFFNGLLVTPDDQGYVGYNSPHEVYVEVISYQKAISDACKRNAILFHKLGLPPELKKATTTNGPGGAVPEIPLAVAGNGECPSANGKLGESVMPVEGKLGGETREEL